MQECEIGRSDLCFEADFMNRLELGAGGGLVGLGVAIGCELENEILISDQENMIDLMRKNIELNGLESKAKELVLNW